MTYTYVGDLVPGMRGIRPADAGYDMDTIPVFPAWPPAP